MTRFKLTLLTSLFIALATCFRPGPVRADWPPFDFDMTPSISDGKIIYEIKLDKRTEEPLNDVLFKIPLPAGTRFLTANAQPSTGVSFDGQEVTFFTAVLHRPIQTASFTVEAIDPAQTTFTTRAWIAWKGQQPGDYLTGPVSLDLTKNRLDWSRPRLRLTLDMEAIMVGDLITYTIYPHKQTGRRMWDLRINIPLPPGTTFLSAKAPSSFVTAFDGREVSFSTLEVVEPEPGPLVVQVSSADVTEPVISTFAWATWRNQGRAVGLTIEPREDFRSGNVMVRLDQTQQVVADPIGDVPLAGYDLTGVALQPGPDALQVDFYTVDNLGPVGEPLEFMLYVDNDCRRETGGARGNLGAEYWLRYKHTLNKAAIYTWDEMDKGWIEPQLVKADGVSQPRTVTVWAPNDLLAEDSALCWLGRARNQSDLFEPGPPDDWTTTGPRLTQKLPEFR